MIEIPSLPDMADVINKYNLTYFYTLTNGQETTFMNLIIETSGGHLYP